LSTKVGEAGSSDGRIDPANKSVFTVDLAEMADLRFENEPRESADDPDDMRLTC
jgi:hypothetical protein